MNKIMFLGISILVLIGSLNSQVKDVEGRTYKTIDMFGNLWMAENLETSKFKNGEIIKQVKNLDEWTIACKNKESVYIIDPKNPTLGKIYNGFAVTDRRGLAPEGYVIPSSNYFDWFTLNSSYITLSKNISKSQFLGNLVNSKGYKSDCSESESTYIGSECEFDNAGNMKGCGFNFQSINSHGVWWLLDDGEMSFCTSRCTGMDGAYFGIEKEDSLNPGDYYLFPPDDWKSYGFYVRCVKLGTNFPVFQSIDDAFAKKDQQISLVIHSEKLMSLDSIFACNKLKRLQLSSCEIEILPDKFDQFTEMTHLDLSSNKFKKLPLSFGKLKKLEYLNLEYCFDLKIDFQILQLLTNCKYMKIPKDYQNETYFNEQVNQLKKILPNCKIE